MKDQRVNREWYSYAQEMASICDKLDNSSAQTSKFKINLDEPKDNSIPRIIGVSKIRISELCMPNQIIICNFLKSEKKEKIISIIIND